MFAEQFKKLRRSRGYTQVHLAEKLGVKKQSVSNWENNNILPSVEMLLKIAETFRVSTDYLLGRTHRAFQDGTYIEVTGLSETEILHVEQIVKDLRNK